MMHKYLSKLYYTQLHVLMESDLVISKSSQNSRLLTQGDHSFSLSVHQGFENEATGQ